VSGGLKVAVGGIQAFEATPVLETSMPATGAGIRSHASSEFISAAFDGALYQAPVDQS
jgi:hypothetical protein